MAEEKKKTTTKTKSKAKTKPKTKKCKYCKTDIPYGAKICPNCRKKQSSKAKWIIIAIIVILVLAGAMGENRENSQKAKSSESNSVGEGGQKQASYTPASVGDMMTALRENAMSASDTYKDQNLEIRGGLSNIDSSGKYISLIPENDPFAIIGVQCYIKTDEQREIVKGMKTGDIVTLRGKCTDVGEVIGYLLDIEEFVQ